MSKSNFGTIALVGLGAYILYQGVGGKLDALSKLLPDWGTGGNNGNPLPNYIPWPGGGGGGSLDLSGLGDLFKGLNLPTAPGGTLGTPDLSGLFGGLLGGGGSGGGNGGGSTGPAGPSSGDIWTDRLLAAGQAALATASIPVATGGAVIGSSIAIGASAAGSYGAIKLFQGLGPAFKAGGGLLGRLISGIGPKAGGMGTLGMLPPALFEGGTGTLSLGWFNNIIRGNSGTSYTGQNIKGIPESAIGGKYTRRFIAQSISVGGKSTGFKDYGNIRTPMGTEARVISVKDPSTYAQSEWGR